MEIRVKVKEVIYPIFDYKNLSVTIFYLENSLIPISRKFCLLQLWNFVLNLKDFKPQNSAFKPFSETYLLQKSIEYDLTEWQYVTDYEKVLDQMAHFVTISTY